MNVTQPGACDTKRTCKGTKPTPSTWIPAHEPRILSADLKEYCVLLEGHLADVGARVHPRIVLPKRVPDRKSMTNECTNLSCGELNPQTSSPRDCQHRRTTFTEQTQSRTRPTPREAHRLSPDIEVEFDFCPGREVIVNPGGVYRVDHCVVEACSSAS